MTHPGPFLPTCKAASEDLASRRILHTRTRSLRPDMSPVAWLSRLLAVAEINARCLCEPLGSVMTDDGDHSDNPSPVSRCRR